MTRARRLYRVYLGLALAGGATVLLAVVVALTRISPGLPTPDGLLAACRRVVPLEPGAGLFLVLLLLALALTVASIGVRSLLHQLRVQRRFLGALRVVQEARIDAVPVTVVDGGRPAAFCAGLSRPRVYVSTEALALLTPSELAAVVAHEAHHRSRRDPLRILAARVLADAFFFLPALRRISDRYRQLAELAADEAAAQGGRGPALASALLRFGERGGEAAPVVGIAPERVEHLLGRGPRWQLPISLIGGSLVVLAGLLGLVLTVPALARSESITLATLLAEGCMVTMVIAAAGVAASAIWLLRASIRPRLAFR